MNTTNTKTANDNLTARISVYLPCDCDVCKSPRSRWFHCPTATSRFVTEYDCEGIDGSGQPTRESVAYVRAEHPACDLVYIGA